MLKEDIWKINMLKHIKKILGEHHETLSEYDVCMDDDTFWDMKIDIETILDEVIEKIRG